jgi:protein O-GlcNAc transferase
VHGLPIVTWPGPLMRGRHTTAILQRMGVTETVAQTLEDYVAIAVRLAQDNLWRASIKQKMAETVELVYRDCDYIRALEDFLWRAAHDERADPTGNQCPSAVWRPHSHTGGERETAS